MRVTYIYYVNLKSNQLEKMIEQNEAVSDEIVQKIKDELLVLLPPDKKNKEQDSNDD